MTTVRTEVVIGSGHEQGGGKTRRDPPPQGSEFRRSARDPRTRSAAVLPRTAAAEGAAVPRSSQIQSSYV